MANTQLAQGQIQFMINCRIKDIVVWLMAAYGLTLTAALDDVYNSDWYSKLLDMDTGLYYQSAAYNYELLKAELKYGQIS